MLPHDSPFLSHLNSHSFLTLCMGRCLNFQTQVSHSTPGVYLGWSLHHWSLVNPKHLFFIFLYSNPLVKFPKGTFGKMFLSFPHLFWWTRKMNHIWQLASPHCTWRIYQKLLHILPLKDVQNLTHLHSLGWYPPCERPVRTQWSKVCFPILRKTASMTHTCQYLQDQPYLHGVPILATWSAQEAHMLLLALWLVKDHDEAWGPDLCISVLDSLMSSLQGIII